MQNILKNSALVFIFIVHLLLALAVNYALPSYKALNIVDAEVKLMDENGKISKERPANGVVRDVYFIYTKNPNSNDKVMVFRNEDTRWGFPFYFKFNSADIHGKSSLFKDGKSLVQVKYYGWRVQMLNEFPNIVSLKKINSESELSHPIVSYALYTILLASFVFFMVKIRKQNI